MRSFICFILAGISMSVVSQRGAAQNEVQKDLQKRVMDLSKRVDELEWKQRLPAQVGGPILFLAGAFCALWAQNTNRSALLWFFLGVFFHVITVLVLLSKNSEDQRRLRGEPVPAPAWGLTLAIVGGLLILAVAFSYIMWTWNP